MLSLNKRKKFKFFLLMNGEKNRNKVTVINDLYFVSKNYFVH